MNESTMSNMSQSKEFPWQKHYHQGTNMWPIPKWNTLPQMFRETAAKYPNHTAYSICLANGLSASLTYKELDEASDAFAAYLRYTLKLNPRDRVALQLPNCLAWPVCAYGAIKAQCILVNINPLYTEHEIEKILIDSGSKILVTLNLFREKLDRMIPKTKVEHTIIGRISEFFPWWSKTLINNVTRITNKTPRTKVKFTTFNKSIEYGRKHLGNSNNNIAALYQNISEEEITNSIALLQYTGGTTGVAKAAILSHKNILTNITQILSMTGHKLQDGKDVIFTALPLYHIFAFTVNALSFYAVGAHIVLIPNPKPISNIKKALSKYKFTWFCGVNTLYNSMLHADWFVNNPPKHLHGCIAGGAALQNSVANRWKSVVGIPIIEGYGLTECSPVVSLNPLDGNDRLGSIGIPLPGTIIETRNEQGEECKVGEIGEIFVCGNQIMSGYWEHEEETQKVLKNDWLATGDLGFRDSDGFFTLVDRKKDMILVSGFNVYPNEIEDCIVKCELVREVAVIGVPDPVSGEQVQAFVVANSPTLTQETLRAHCKQYLTSYKVPKKIIFMSELPKSNIGKILRKEVRAIALERTLDAQ